MQLLYYLCVSQLFLLIGAIPIDETTIDLNPATENTITIFNDTNSLGLPHPYCWPSRHLAPGFHCDRLWQDFMGPLNTHRRIRLASFPDHSRTHYWVQVPVTKRLGSCELKISLSKSYNPFEWLTTSFVLGFYGGRIITTCIKDERESGGGYLELDLPADPSEGIHERNTAIIQFFPEGYAKDGDTQNTTTGATGATATMAPKLPLANGLEAAAVRK